MIVLAGAKLDRPKGLINDAYQRKQQALEHKNRTGRADSNHGRKNGRTRKICSLSRREKQEIVQLAGVPKRYRGRYSYSVEIGLDDSINIYFGGIGRPTGPKHGHYVIDINGIMTYRRERGKPHGSKNFLTGGRAIFLPYVLKAA